MCAHDRLDGMMRSAGYPWSAPWARLIFLLFILLPYRPVAVEAEVTYSSVSGASASVTGNASSTILENSVFLPVVSSSASRKLDILKASKLSSSVSSGQSSRENGHRSRSKRDGSWSDWSVWSPCSRSCGGGIRTQTRQCQLRKSKPNAASADQDAILLTTYTSRNVSSRHCEGHATRHHLCNTQECPSDTPDFRENQCKAFDNRPFMGKVYQWESYVDERSPCSLTCRAKGYRFFATLNKSVIDGTSCTKPTQLDLHVCIAGICTPIGCDGIAGSSRRLDICGVCGGDNSTCRLVSGIFTRPQLALGYNVVAHIPKGACKLNITEIRNTANTLALRKQDGSFVLNGPEFRKPSWPGVYDGAGTMFQYTRGGGGKGDAQVEMISSAGPLREPVDLMVLYQQPNPGIKYEYILPLGDGPAPPPTPLMDTPGVGGGGGSGRVLLAATSRPGDFVRGPGKLKSLEGVEGQHHHHHNHGGRRRGGQHEGGGDKRDSSLMAAESAVPQGKKFYWKITGYSNCSEPCGGGVQRSVIRCVRHPQGNAVSERRCSQDQERPPGQVIRCNLKPCPAEWVLGEWGNCTAEECGSGWKTRSVWCEQRISEKLKMKVMEGACLKKKPEVRAGCKRDSCYAWREGEWSECSAACGNGVRKREVNCVEKKNGGKVERQRCEGQVPEDIRPCNMGPCGEGADWFVGEWARDCSQRCGQGVQTRVVVCAKGPGACDEGQRPEGERECFSERGCGEPQWFTGPWGKCTAGCHGENGYRTRQVLCVIFSRGRFKVVGEGLCEQKEKPGSKGACEGERECGARWLTTDWGECSVDCGGGVQKRRVSCREANWTTASVQCTDKDRPVERRGCNEQKCSLGGGGGKKEPRGEGVGKVLEMVSAGTTTTTTMTTSASSTNSSLGVGGTQGKSRNSRGGRSSPPPPPTTGKSAEELKQQQQQGDRQQEEPNEEPDEPECSDQYRNCALVVQARLCRYKYYRSVCCNSCAEAPPLTASSQN